ncbi:MAG TPA: heavy-metal-associated domain-containing protein [Saprospiraceae bacterium]|nr:heavy-metal-associated domain-containing protein [Saprospiraceae bacterium]HND89328.1 heavy-metal-associated domain-containing protein [Saprospiraceae bacterium]
MKVLQLLLIILLSVSVSAAQAQTEGMVKKKAKSVVSTEAHTFMVLGNCGMCEKTIEKAALDAGATSAAWNVENDSLTVIFDPAKTSVDSIQKSVAKSGYDNAGYKAPDAVYRRLHSCCQYDRTGAAGGLKTCDDPAQPKH